MQAATYTLKSSEAEIEITNYGGRITAIRVPDRHGRIDNIVLGFDQVDDYFGDNPYFGALIGRYANRIASAQFTLNGKTYKIAANDGVNSLHGGVKGFDKVFWEAHRVDSGLVLTYLSRDGEDGYPGNLAVTVTYTLRAGDLAIDYRATTDQATVLNLTNHSYFNLGGNALGTILDTQLLLESDSYLPVDRGLIPTGELRSVEGTAFDFRQSRAIGEGIADSDPQLKICGGYDHCFVLRPGAEGLRRVALAHDPHSGRTLEILTTQPAIQFYTGNSLHPPHTAFCLETEHYPNSPNEPSFPSTTLRPGEEFSSSTVLRFSAG